MSLYYTRHTNARIFCVFLGDKAAFVLAFTAGLIPAGSVGSGFLPRDSHAGQLRFAFHRVCRHHLHLA